MEERKPINPQIPDMGTPKVPSPEPLQMPRPGPQPLQASPGLRPPMKVPDIRPPTASLRPVKPHVYVKVSSYKQIMERLNEMSKEVGRIRSLIGEMDSLTRQESQKIMVFNQVLSKLREDLDFVENIFTQPEE